MGLLGNAKKLLAGHQKEVDQAINKAAQLAKEHTPNAGDKVIDQAAKKAKEEL